MGPPGVGKIPGLNLHRFAPLIASRAAVLAARIEAEIRVATTWHLPMPGRLILHMTQSACNPLFLLDYEIRDRWAKRHVRGSRLLAPPEVLEPGVETTTSNERSSLEADDGPMTVLSPRTR